MSTYDFDYFVIGAGSGGVRSARIAGQHGARVGIAEERYLGGTCVNVGCVPKKLLSYASHFAEDFEDAEGFGWTVGDRTHSWKRLIENKNQEIERLNGIYNNLLEGAGVKQYWGTGRLADAHTVVVRADDGTETSVTAEKILIAVGGWPAVPPLPGANEHAITSNEAFFLDDLPKRVIVAGGGYIAVEFAGIFNGLGAEVLLLYRGHKIMRGFDDDVRDFLTEEMVKKGIDLRLNTIIERLDRTSTCRLAHLSDGSQEEVDQVMFAIGRVPNTDRLGLDAAGIATRDNGAIIVDEQYRTSVENIYALGDVTDRVNLTPVAIAEGHWLADHLFAAGRPDVIYDNIPTAVFSNPPIGTVGLTEAQARERGHTVDIYRSTFRPMKHTLSGRQERTLMKLVVERESDRVLGCHMVGIDAPEIAQGLGIALAAGATKAQFDQTIGIHPTAAEEFVTMRTRAPDPTEQVQKAAE